MDKVAIVVVVYNSTMIHKQIECIRKYCIDDHHIVVIDNSTNKKASEFTKYHSENDEAQYFKCNASSSNGSDSHAFACNFAMDKLYPHYRFFFYLDHDNFPIKKFSVKRSLKGKVITGIAQHKPPNQKIYFWPGCVMLDTKDIEKPMIDFSTNHEERLDTGGNLFKITEKFGIEKFGSFDEVSYENPYYKGELYNYYALLDNGTYMHFINSSNWAEASGNEERVNSLLTVLGEWMAVETKRVLFINHKQKQCGVYQYGLRTANILKKSLNYDIFYCEFENKEEFHAAQLSLSHPPHTPVFH